MSVLHNHNQMHQLSVGGVSSTTFSTTGSTTTGTSSHSHHSNNSNSLALARPYNNGERGIFRAAKELCRFVMTTIVVANASKCTANAASIIANYHKTAAARSGNGSRKSADNFNLLSKANNDGVVKENNINLWHFRTFSTCSAGSPFEDSDSLESVFTSGGSGRRTRQSQYASDGNDAMVATVSSSTGTHNQASAVNSVNNQKQDYYEPSLAQMRAQLGPIGLLVANAVEVGVTTASSYISGGLFGYFIGGAMNAPGVFRKSAANVNPALGLPPPMKSAAPNAGMKEIQRRIGDWNSKALTQGKSWGALSASFSGFHALTRVCRGGVEDRWNSVIGSAATGAYLSRQGGPQAMLQGASTYAGFTYVLDTMFGNGKPNTEREREFEFTDTPIEDRGY